MTNKKFKNKKALSTVVATVVIIMLTVAAIAIVWTFVKAMVEKNRDQVESCFDIESGQKVSLNGLYTCYDLDAEGNLDEVQVSISVADVEIETLVISIMTGGSTKTVTLTSTETGYTDVKPYSPDPDETNYGNPVSLPGENSGKTYVIRGFQEGLTEVDWIRIAPIVNGNQCGITDQINDVSNCAYLG